MNKIQKYALFYLLGLLAVAYVYSVGRFGVFPGVHVNQFIDELAAFDAGAAGEKETSVVDKIKHDLGLGFERLRYPYPARASKDASPVSSTSFSDSRDDPLIFIAPQHREGFRIVSGGLNLKNGFWGALLISPQGEILHTWTLSSEHLPGNAAKDQLKSLYGLHIYPDGSVIFNLQEQSGGIVKVDACSRPLWALEGVYHHTVSPTEDGNFWTFVGSMQDFDQDMVLASAETGEVLKTIQMKDVRNANKDVRVWNLIRYELGMHKKSTRKERLRDISHGNDIDALPSHLAEHFPMFDVGDVVVSYATNSLVFVLDPDTLKIKWWRVGATDYQHDPDWEASGKIAIFSNNIRSLEFSDIVAIDPASMAHTREVDGRKYGFKPGVNGMHQRTEFGTRMVTSAQQGWAFEVDDSGKLVFSFVNTADAEAGDAYHMSDAVRVSDDFFEGSFWETCAGAD